MTCPCASCAAATPSSGNPAIDMGEVGLLSAPRPGLDNAEYAISNNARWDGERIVPPTEYVFTLTVKGTAEAVTDVMSAALNAVAAP